MVLLKVLTVKQRRFVEEYVIDCNGTQAAIRAGYSERTAQEQSSRLLSNAMVKEAVKKAMQEKSEECGVTAEFVLKGLKGEAKLDTKKGGSASARVRALELLGKHRGMFREGIDLTGSVIVQTVEGVAKEEVLGEDQE
jgi:phage terminase small subunit